jgi:hypothetical protein
MFDKVVDSFAILSPILFPGTAFLNGVWQSDQGIFWNEYSPRISLEIWQPIFFRWRKKLGFGPDRTVSPVLHLGFSYETRETPCSRYKTNHTSPLLA